MQASAFFGQIFSENFCQTLRNMHTISMRVISASAANRKSRSRAISDEVQVSKNEFLFASVVADGDAAGETTKFLDSRMAQAEGVSTSRSAAVSGGGFTLWIEHSCVRTKQFWGTTSMHFWTVTFMGGTVSLPTLFVFRRGYLPLRGGLWELLIRPC